jgi:hypothetical protein
MNIRDEIVQNFVARAPVRVSRAIERDMEKDHVKTNCDTAQFRAVIE